MSDAFLLLVSLVVAVIFVIVIISNQKKENLSLCNNLGGSIYKSVDYNPADYNYPENNPYY